MSRRIAVLMGGRSSERAVSLVSGAACAAALRTLGHEVVEIDAAAAVKTLLDHLEGSAVVFNALHGAYGEDGRVQGLLDLLGLPYTHSSVRASALAMHKPTANRLFAAAGLRTPAGIALPAREARLPDALPAWLRDGAIVAKPADGGSSVDVAVLDSAAGLPAYADAAPDEAEILIEMFAPGRELTVAVLGEGDGARALAVTDIRPQDGGLYDYSAKYDEALVARHILPAEMPVETYQDALAMALAAHRALGCRGLSRADLRWDEAAGMLTLLEVNTQPGMTAVSLAPEQAAFAGLSFEALCARLVEDARCG